MTTLSIINSPALQLRLELTDNGSASQLDITLENTLERELSPWCLHLDLQREVVAGVGTRLTRVGSHLQLSPADAGVLAPGATCALQLQGASQLLQRLSDLPSGCFLSVGEDVLPVRLVGHNLAPARQCNGEATVTPAQSTGISLLPAPARMSAAAGHRPWPAVAAVHAVPEASSAIDWLRSMLDQPGIDPWIECRHSAAADLLCTIDNSLAGEAYRLDITDQQARLCASTQAGFCRGAATLLQLLEEDPQRQSLPCLSLEDEPRYAYRGLMLDCARHYQSVDTLLDLLDWMALYKLNHFHWHLTDDEAWRLEITALPELTDIGAWRGHAETLPPQLGSGPRRYGGFYSQADVRRVVEHAAARAITVVPEIDIPGHCRACIQSLPQLLQEPQDRSRYQSVQFFNDNVLNPGLSGTYEFLATVLQEVCELFPGRYIHLGGDEVPEGAWTGSPACRALMDREGYSEPRELHGHLLRYAQAFLAQRGRTMAGWEEAAQGGELRRDAPICAWTGDTAISEVADAGFPVISCLAPQAYLDLAWSEDPGEPGLHWAGTAGLRECYEKSPFPQAIDRAMGVQANLWSELLTSKQQLEYMLFPRLLATAEWGWYGDAGNDWPGFRARVETQLEHLRHRGLSPRALGPED